MTTFPPGAPNFQLPSPHKGVVYATEDGSVYVLRDGVSVRVWWPGPVNLPNQNTGD